MKPFVKVLICLAISSLIVFGGPYVFKIIGNETVNHQNEVSAVKQEVLSYSNDEQPYFKLYNEGKLIGVVSNKEYFENRIKEIGKQYAPNIENEVGLQDGVYFTPEKSFSVFENVDDKIANYIFNNNLYGVKAHSVEFSTSEGIYDIIYVSDVEKFYTARDEFLTNFISEEALEALRNKTKIDDITNFGTIETDAHIQETITVSDAVVRPSEIFENEDQIYEYLCYGRNNNREYYTIQEGDTLPGIGYFFGNLSAKQIVSLNRGILTSTDQILNPGTVLNVTYFTSPITVVVTKQRLVQETITPDNPEYIRDSSIGAGKIEIVSDEVVGLENVLYQEEWINGVLQSGNEISSKVVREPIQGVIRIGVGATFQLGTGNFAWPTENPHITCGYACYVMNGQIHNGTDIENRYNRWGPVLASDSGTVEKVSYDNLSGNYVIVNHNNGYKTYYGHMSAVYVSVGQAVERGQLIGQIGMTGYATGPHIHFMMYVENNSGAFDIVNVCTIMDCTSIY